MIEILKIIPCKRGLGTLASSDMDGYISLFLDFLYMIYRYTKLFVEPQEPYIFYSDYH